MMDRNKIIGERIGKARTSRGESQADLAASLGVKREQVTYWENGTRSIKAETLIQIAERYNVSLDYLCGKQDAMTTDANIKMICGYTGLSEEAVYTLARLSEADDHNRGITRLIEYIDKLISFFSLEFLLSLRNLDIACYECKKRTEENAPMSFDEYVKMREHIESRLYAFHRFAYSIPERLGIDADSIISDAYGHVEGSHYGNG